MLVVKLKLTASTQWALWTFAFSLMRILIVTQYFYPEPEAIPFELAVGLRALGHEVGVFTGFPNYPYGKIFDGYTQSLYLREQIEGVEVCRFPLYPDRSRNVLGRILYYLSLASSISLVSPFLTRQRPDVIFVYHPITLTIPALLLTLLFRSRLVINIQDMYPESLSATGLADQNFVIRLVGGFAKFMYRQASKMVVISQGFKNNLCAKGVPPNKIDVVYNWADEDIYRPVERNQELAQKWGLQGRFNIMYTGSMGPPQGLSVVLEAAVQLNDLPEIQFVLLGDGLDLKDLQEQAKLRRLRNVRFIPRHPMQEVPGFISFADGLLVHLIDDPLFEITFPSKVQSYLACAKPLVVGLRGEVGDLLESHRCGVSFIPSDPISLVRAVRELYGIGQAERSRMGESARALFFEKFTKKAGIEGYARAFASLLGPSKGLDLSQAKEEIESNADTSYPKIGTM